MASNSPPAKRPANRRRSTSEVQQWAEQLPASFLLCRDLGHVWQPRDAWNDTKQRCYVQTMLCGRCQAERRRQLDYQGNRLGQSYDYQDDYLAPQGTGVLSAAGRADLRLTSLLRLLASSTPADDQLAARRRTRKAG